MEKKWYQSSTIWINLVGVIATVLEILVNSNLLPDPEYVALAVAILNIINRFRVPKKVLPIEKSVL